MGSAPQSIRTLEILQTPPGSVSRNWLHIVNNGIGEPYRIPILVARGRRDGPVLGLTAALHGNELNGIPIIQRLIAQLDLEALRGTVVGVLAVNVPGLLLGQRPFNDGADLNRIAPGSAAGTSSQVYLHRFIERVVRRFDFLIDLHTASEGRVNSHYVRADMEHPVTARLARLQNADIIVHNPPNDTTVRGTAASLGIPAVTVELRDPGLFQPDVIQQGREGVRNVLVDLGMLEGEVLCPATPTLLCSNSYWLYTDEGGILSVLPEVTEAVGSGAVIARVRDIFGDITREYRAPESGVVIGKSINPINQTGSRILHLGLSPRPLPCITAPADDQKR